MLLANQATPAAFPHTLFNQSSVRVESLICLSRLICLIEAQCVFSSFSSGRTPTAGQRCRRIFLIQLLCDLILCIHGMDLQWLKCIADIAQKWLVCSWYRFSWYIFFPHKQIFTQICLGKNILCRCWRRPGYLHPLSEKNNNWGHLPWYALMHMKNVHK